MTDRASGRNPAVFSREFGAALWARIEKATPKITGQRLAAELNRRDAYVSDRKHGKSSWTVDDVDVIAGLMDTTGLELIAAILGDMGSGANVTPLQPKSPKRPPARKVNLPATEAARDD